MLRRISEDKPILVTLTVNGQGESIKFDVTYHNRKQSEVQAKMDAMGDDIEGGVADAVLFMVKDWDAEYPLTAEGLKEVEDERPGLIMAVIQGYAQARQMAKAKN